MSGCNKPTAGIGKDFGGGKHHIYRGGDGVDIEINRVWGTWRVSMAHDACDAGRDDGQWRCDGRLGGYYFSRFI